MIRNNPFRRTLFCQQVVKLLLWGLSINFVIGSVMEAATPWRLGNDATSLTFTSEAVNVPDIFATAPFMKRSRWELIKSSPAQRRKPARHAGLTALFLIATAGIFPSQTAAQAISQAFLSNENNFAAQATAAEDNLARNPPSTLAYSVILKNQFFARVRHFLLSHGVDPGKYALYTIETREGDNRSAETTPAVDSRDEFHGTFNLGISDKFLKERKYRAIIETTFFDYLLIHEKDHMDRIPDALRKRALIIAIIHQKNIPIQDEGEFRDLVYLAIQGHILEPLGDQAAIDEFKLTGKKFTKETKEIMKIHETMYPAMYKDALRSMTAAQSDEVLRLIDKSKEELETQLQKLPIMQPIRRGQNIMNEAA